MTDKPTPILHLVDPSGNVVPVKRHSLKKNADGSPVLKAGWKLAAPAKK